MTEDAAARKPLKRLSIVHRYVDVAASYGVAGQSLYKKVRAQTPGFVEPYVKYAEDTATAYAAPVAAYSADTADKVLYFADEKVDAALVTAENLVKTTHSNVNATLSKAYEVHNKNVETAKAAANKYFELVSSTGQWVAETLSPQKNVQFAKDVLNSTIEKAKLITDPDVAVQTVADAWSKFAAIPTVATLLKTAEPATNAGFQTFYKAHDVVVASPYYKKVLDVGVSLASYATTTTPYKLGAHYLYPIVAPVADPTIKKLSDSEVVATTLTYWKPAA